MIIPVAHRADQTQEYYFSVKLAEVRQLMAAGHDVINIGIGNPDLMPSDATLDALITSVRQPNAHGYQSYKGIPAFRAAIARFYDHTYGIALNPETEILPLIGSKEGITHLALTFLNEGDHVLVPELGYPSYRAVSQMVGAHVREYPLLEEDGWQPDWAAMADLISERTKIIWLNYPHMPTGAPATQTLFERAVQFAHDHRVLLCHDNPYSLILNKKPPISLLCIDGAKAVAVELNSMSKSHNMAGWRIGWLAGAKPYVDAVLTIKSNVDSGTFLAVQQAAVAALANSDDWHRRRNAVYKGRLGAAKAFWTRSAAPTPTTRKVYFCGPNCPIRSRRPKRWSMICSTTNTFSSHRDSFLDRRETATSGCHCVCPKNGFGRPLSGLFPEFVQT